MNITRERAESLLTQLTHDHDAALRLAGGSDDVVLDRTKTSHDDFTDLPVLAAANAEESDARARVTDAIRALTLAFFDWSLRGKQPALLVKTPAEPLIESIRRFGTAP